MVQAEPEAGTHGGVVGAWLGRAAGTARNLRFTL